MVMAEREFQLLFEEQESLRSNLKEIRQAWLEMNEALKRIEHVQVNHQQILDFLSMQHYNKTSLK